MGSSKWTEDYLKGKVDRALVRQNLNKDLERYGLIIEPFHTFSKTMRPEEKFHYNTKKNRMSKVSLVRAMGIDYCILDKTNYESVQPVLVRFSNDFGVYIKLPTDYIDRPEDFLRLIESYWFIFVKRESGIGVCNQYANILSVKEIVKRYRWKLSDSKGNKNRLGFNMNPDIFDYRNPIMEDLFGDSFMDIILKRFRR